MVDSDLEVRKKPVFVCFPCLLFFLSTIFFNQNKGGGRDGGGEAPLALPLDLPLQVDKYKEMTGFDVYSLGIFKACFQT